MQKGNFEGEKGLAQDMPGQDQWSIYWKWLDRGKNWYGADWSVLGRVHNYEGGVASHCEVLGHSAVISAKTAELNKMPFGLWAQAVVLDGVLRDVAMATNFGTQLGVTGFLDFDEL